MVQLIEDHLEDIRSLCRKYRVQSLYVFGSTVTDRFKPEESDIDFLVTFEEMDPFEFFDAYMGLEESLDHLFSRPIDLVSERAIKNPYFREEVEETRVKLYAA